MNASLFRTAAVFVFLGAGWSRTAGAQTEGDETIEENPRLSSELFPEGASDDQSQGRSGEIVWKNGDSLRGRIANDDSGDKNEGNRLIWKSELFSQPLALDPARLRSLVFDLSRAAASLENSAQPRFRVVTHDRNSIDGELLSIDRKQIRLRRSGSGNIITIIRDDVIEIIGLDSPDLLLHGFNRDGAWNRIDDEGQSDSGWSLAANGRFEATRWRAEAQFDLDADDSFLVELQLSSSDQRPDFSVGFDGTDKGLALETWQDELVLNFGDAFASVMTLGNRVRELHLLIGIDSDRQEAMVFDVSGKQLATLNFSSQGRIWKVSEALIDLKNKGANLAVERLVVRRWGLESSDKLALTANQGIQLGSGEVISGDLSTLRLEEGKTLAIGKGSSRKLIQLDELASITLARPPQSVDRSLDFIEGDDSISFSDGQFLSGTLLSIDTDGVRMKASFSDEPIELSLEGVRELSFRNGQSAPPGRFIDDHLFSKGQHLSGAIVDGRSLGRAIAWKCDGADNAVLIRDGANSRIVRGALPGGPGKDWHQTYDNKDRLVLRSNEVVACRVGEIDGEFVHFSEAVAAGERIPLTQVKAVEFSDQAEHKQGFDDVRWRVLSDDPASVSRTENQVAFMASKSGKIGHTSALAARELSFDLSFGKKGQGGAMRMRLFGASADDTDDGMALTILASGSRVWATRARQGQPFTFSNNGLQGINMHPLPVRLKLIESRVEVYIGDRMALSEEINEETPVGHALQFSVDPMSVRYGGPNSVISISGLEIIREKGSHDELKVSAAALHEAVSVPRFRRTNPQRHVLIANNGDLLRGHLISANRSAVSFRSRLEEVQVPRHRIAGLIWLDDIERHKRDETVAVESKTKHSEVDVILNDGSRIRLIARELGSEFLRGESQLLGSCDIPLSDVRELRTVDPAKSAANVDEYAFYSDWQLAVAKEPEIPSSEDAEAARGRTHESVGTEALTLKLPLLDGGEFDLSAAAGRVVVLDFWATWCGPCVKAIPEYLEAISGFDSERVQFVGVNQSESAEVIGEFLKRRDWQFDVALDQNGKVGASYGVTGIPHTVVVDSEGKIAWVHTGYTPEGAAGLKAAIQGLLAE